MIDVKRIGPVIGLLLALLLVLTSVAPAIADNSRLLDQARSRQRVIDADLRSLQQEMRGTEFGSRVYWEQRRTVSALQSERSALRNLESALRSGDERRIERANTDYRRASDRAAQQRRSLIDTRTRELQFGSRDWHQHRRTSSTMRQQQRATEPFGPEYRRSIEAQIRLMETRRSQLRFGSSEWHAVNRQLSALRQALRTAR